MVLVDMEDRKLFYLPSTAGHASAAAASAENLKQRKYQKLIRN